MSIDASARIDTAAPTVYAAVQQILNVYHEQFTQAAA